MFLGLAAIPAGIASGAAYDTASTLITDQPQGIVAAVDNFAKNPNAGTLIDAIAVPAGDALAGYSGGNIGKQIGNNIKAGRLVAQRAVKLDQMDSAPTSGQALSIANEINVLTSQISQLEAGTPQYWWNPKTRQVVITKPTTNSVPVVGHTPPAHEEQTYSKSKDDYWFMLYVDI